MDNSIFKILKGDKVIWILFFLLFIISLIEMFSASSYLVSRSGSISGPIVRHVFFFILGFVAIGCAILFPYRHIRLFGYVGLIISWILLIFALIRGGDGQAGDAARSIMIAGIPFQPSEFARISLIIVIADFVYRYSLTEQRRMMFFLYAGIMCFTCALIFPENFSTSAIIFTVCSIMMVIGCVDFKYIGTLWLIAIILVVGVVSVVVLVPQEWYGDNAFWTFFERAYTWVARITNFANADEASKYIINDKNYQVAHAQIAIARGGFLGELPGNSIQRNFLPEAYSDFIFAIIVEELGSFGGLIVIGIYLSIFFRAGVIAKQSRSLFSTTLVIGVSLIIVLQAFIHMAVSVQLIPVTGQPLPLISRGGTSILINCLYFGLIFNVANQIALEKAGKSNLYTGGDDDENDITSDDEKKEITNVNVHDDSPFVETIIIEENND